MRLFFLHRLCGALLIAISLTITWLLWTPAVVQAATIRVTTTEDENNGDGDCSLREAIRAANTDQAVDGCGAGSGHDVIHLATNATYLLGTVDVNLEGPNGLPTVDTKIDLEGNGATVQRAANAPPLRLFSVSIPGDLTIRQLTIANGLAPGTNVGGKSGGGLLSYGKATLDHVTFRNNVGGDKGGAIYNTGTLILNHCDLHDNSSNGPGDGIYSDTNLTVNDSTFSNNGDGIYNLHTVAVNRTTFSEPSVGMITQNVFTVIGSTFRQNNIGIQASGLGGVIQQSAFVGNATGLLNQANPVSIENSTFDGQTQHAIDNSGNIQLSNSTFVNNSANNAGGQGGAILNQGTFVIQSSTFVNNSAQDRGGAIANIAGTLTLQGSTLAHNSAGSGGGALYNAASATLHTTIVAHSPDHQHCLGSITDDGYNLDSGATCGFDGALASLSNTNPLLAALADNGGDTQTLALLPGSPAIDAFVTFGECSADQRGQVRPLGKNCDIGAYEADATAADLTLTVSDNDPVRVGDPIRYTIAVTNQGPDTAHQVVVLNTPGFVYDFVSSTVPCLVDEAGVLICTVGTLAAGASHSLEIVVQPGGVGTFTNAFVVASNMTDPESANDSVQEATTVIASTTPILTIIFDSQPDSTRNVRFDGSVGIGRFWLDDPMSDDGDAYQNRKTFTLPPGIYTIRERVSSGWFLTDISCDSGDSAPDLATTSVTLPLNPGDERTCLFIDQRGAIIRGESYEDINGNGRRNTRNPFEPWQPGWTFRLLTEADQQVGADQVSNATGRVSFTGLRQGIYKLCLVLPVGWFNTQPNSGAAMPCYFVTVNYQSVTVPPLRFGNRQVPAILASQAEAEPVGLQILPDFTTDDSNDAPFVDPWLTASEAEAEATAQRAKSYLPLIYK